MKVEEGKPHVRVPGDTDGTYIMYRAGRCVGLGRELKVWRFGFMPGSDSAFHYGIAIDNTEQYGFMWVLSDYEGNVRDVFKGAYIQLPQVFVDVFNEKWQWSG